MGSNSIRTFMKENWMAKGVLRTVTLPNPSSQYDMALLELEEPLKTYLPNMIPICLPSSNTNFDGEFAYASGWEKRLLCFFLSLSLSLPVTAASEN